MIMATGENKLYIVERQMFNTCKITKRFIFRTREAARNFAKAQRKISKTAWYNVLPAATWGPEQ